MGFPLTSSILAGIEPYKPEINHPAMGVAGYPAAQHWPTWAAHDKAH